jgi:uncharacterized protein (TIGR02145 family)
MKQVRYKLLLLAGLLPLSASMISGCTEDLGTELTSKRIMLAVDDFGFDASRGITRGAKVSSISSFGVSATVYDASASYTSAGCGSYFYKQAATNGSPLSFFWPTADYKLAFYAYYPYGNAAFTVQSSANTTGAPTYAYTVPSAIASQVDVMTGQTVNVLGGGTSPVAISMKHRCAAICFSVTNDRSSAITLSSISIEGVKYAGTLCEETWTLSSAVNSSFVNPFTLSYGSSIAAGATANVTGTSNIFLMLPQSIPVGARLKVVVAGEDPLYADLAGSWVAGKQYNYSLTVNNNVIVVVDEDTEVADWIYPTFVDLGLPSGTKWARGNIVSDGNGGYMVGEETDYGAYFSWGNVTPHFSSNGSTFDDGYDWGTEYANTVYPNTAGASISFTSQHYGRDYPANTTNDAARACLGGNWQVPTATQFQELYDNTDNEYTTINGVGGRKFMKKSDHSIFVFFPFCGKGYSTGFNGLGVDGSLYWSSSLYDDDHGCCAFYNDQSFNPYAFINTYRLLGLPVRAVQ